MQVTTTRMKPMAFEEKSLWNNRKLQSVALVSVIGLAIWFGFYCSNLAGNDPHTYKIDYNVFYAAWQSVLNRAGNPYAQQISPATPYLYPPLFAQLFSPLGLLSIRTAAAVWYLIGVTCLIASLFLSQRLARLTGRSRGDSIALIFLAFVMVARFGLDNLRMGQINLLIVALTIAALYLYERDYFCGRIDIGNGDQFQGYARVISRLFFCKGTMEICGYDRSSDRVIKRFVVSSNGEASARSL